MSKSQIEYEIDQLEKARKAIIKQEAAEKVDEFTKILTDSPAKDENELRRILNMLSADLKNIYNQ
ncbi:hypothetical protein ASF12_22510 [Paenibacillus sp. Leaf72]|nr:hypothetical protein ASF12_22510 [Paenibacillus sp. Leaf72]